MNTETKYRPYLTASELLHILECLKKISPNTALIKNLENYSLRINAGTIAPSLIPKPNIASSLGLGFSESINPAHLPLGTLKEQAFNKWKVNPASCTPIEIGRVQMYRYENDMMSSDEEQDYEKRMGI